MTDRNLLLGRMLEMTTLLGRDMENDLARRGLSVPRAHVLWVLYERGPITQKELAAHLEATPRNVSGLVDGLESTGFVARTPHPSDRRAVHVALAPRGTAVVEAMDAERVGLVALLFDGIPAASLAEFAATLDTVTARIRSAVDAGAR